MGFCDDLCCATIATARHLTVHGVDCVMPGPKVRSSVSSPVPSCGLPRRGPTKRCPHRGSSLRQSATGAWASARTSAARRPNRTPPQGPWVDFEIPSGRGSRGCPQLPPSLPVRAAERRSAAAATIQGRQVPREARSGEFFWSIQQPLHPGRRWPTEGADGHGRWARRLK